MIPNGSLLTYTGTWYASLFSSASTIVADVSQNLTTSGLPVRNQKINESLGAVAGGIAGLGGNTFTVTLQLQVENGLGFNSPDDVINVIRHWVYEETGQFPTSDSMPYVQPASGGKPISTGQPDIIAADGTGGTPKCISGESSDTTGSFNLSCWWGNLTSKGLSVVGLLALVVVAGVGIFIYYSPQRVRIT